MEGKNMGEVKHVEYCKLVIPLIPSISQSINDVDRRSENFSNNF